MITIMSLVEYHFVRTLSVVCALLFLCGYFACRIKENQVIKSILHIASVILLVFIFSFVSIKSDLVEHSKEENPTVYKDLSPSEIFTYEERYILNE